MSVAAMPVPIRLSTEQEAILRWVREEKGSALIEAVAGAGKTFILGEIANIPGGSSAYVVYNKKNSDEAKTKMGHMQHLSIGTCHSFGLGAWKDHIGKVHVSAWDKRDMMIKENHVPEILVQAVGRLVSLMKQTMAGYSYPIDEISPIISLIQHYDVLWKVDDTPTPESEIIEQLVSYAQKCTHWSMKTEHIIDFDDMIWLPLVNDVPIRQYDRVLLDEGQDLNMSRQLLTTRMLKKGGRLMAVGDRNQAIYGFTGADSEALDHIAEEHDCLAMPLSTTYRCSKAATALAQKFVPHIEAHEDNSEGSVREKSFDTFWLDYVASPLDDSPSLGSGDAILCRMTRPLITLAFMLIQTGIGCYVEGRDIGKQLERMATKWKVKSTVDLSSRLEGYRQHELAKLNARKAWGAIAALNDRIETLYIIMGGCETVNEVVAKIQHLFKDSGTGTPSMVVLSTIHKAKGREWDRVFVLGWSEYMPSSWAKQAWEMGQERNLQYVAVTRTKRDLILITNGI